MSSITIPHELHQRMLAEWKVEYEAEFGALDAVVEFATADEWTDHYARMIRFWTRRVPEISMAERPSMETVCAHAIASNAVANMWKPVKERGLEVAVQSRLDALD